MKIRDLLVIVVLLLLITMLMLDKKKEMIKAGQEAADVVRHSTH